MGRLLRRRRKRGRHYSPTRRLCDIAHHSFPSFSPHPFLGKQLDASGNKLGSEGGKAIAEALKTNSTLDSIVIGSKDKPATIPLKELRENSIDALDYQGKELLAEGGIVLASALKGNSSVTKVGQHAFNVFIFFFSL